MTKSLHKLLAVCLIVSLVLGLAGCKKNKSEEIPERSLETEDIITQALEPTKAPTATPMPTATPTPEPTPTPELHIGEVRSKLDGSWIKEEIANKRPWAVALNNISAANPQSGVGEAKIVYEALTEGGITRLLAIFEGIDETFACADRIGSVRSARHYFASFADEWDSIYIHFGETKYATEKIKELKMDDLNCMEGVGNDTYYRDKEIKAPHNAFCTVALLNKAFEKGKYRLEHKEGFNANHFNINEECLYPLSEATTQNAASKITLSYDKWFVPYFTYDPETQLYTRFQFGKEHIDYNTGEVLTFKNIIIQVVKEWDKDHNHYQDMDIEDTTGHGWYISMGQCVPITWKKCEKDRFMMYYTEDGEILNINPGKSFISIYPDFREDKLVIE